MINNNFQGGNLATQISQKVLEKIIEPIHEIPSGLGYFPIKNAGWHLNLYLLEKSGSIQEARVGRGARKESKLVAAPNFKANHYEINTSDSSILLSKEILDIQDSSSFNYNFKLSAVKDAKLSIELALNRYFFQGGKKVKGLLNNTSISKVNATKTWDTATGNEILEDINKIIEEAENGTIFKPDTIALPPKYWKKLQKPRTEYQNASILKVFRENREGDTKINFIKSVELQKEYHGGTSDYIVCFQNTSNIAEFLLAKDFYMKGGLLDDRGDYKATLYKDFYGLFVYQPDGIKILQGIG